jgi:hypothetical protein
MKKCNPHSHECTNWINTEIQEQTFKRWNKIKDSGRKMGPGMFALMTQMDVLYSLQYHGAMLPRQDLTGM